MKVNQVANQRLVTNWQNIGNTRTQPAALSAVSGLYYMMKISDEINDDETTTTYLPTYT